MNLRVADGIEMETAVAGCRMTDDAVGVDGRTLRGAPRRVRRGVDFATAERGTLAEMLGAFLREEFGRGPLAKLSALIALPVLKRFKNRLDHRRYNGACLLGLKGIVVKSHGSADAFGYGFAIARAADAARTGVLARISERVAQLHPQLESA